MSPDRIGHHFYFIFFVHASWIVFIVDQFVDGEKVYDIFFLICLAF
ncbi:hypothetical protein Acaty_m0141 (plasmid) [Acidithiobacillus caldus ATCC 51756]|uniref:Uncharacterized protein n=1 Tax=Acidithiobacillus caldus (strain ATCC 51756 / DSM 8584 / KU) TaxID=637389 RepID=A0A059ZVD3_ACICK|nr:hypothetical protein Acaty_m0141 [Acidithiobacillus caldus ATCC 51756]